MGPKWSSNWLRPLAFVRQGRLECLTTPSLTITGLNKAREPEDRVTSCHALFPLKLRSQTIAWEEFFFFFFLKEVKIQNISIFTFLTSLDEKWRTRRDRQGCSWAKEKEFIATGYEHLLVGRVILRIVSLSIRMRITPHVAMLLRLQLPRLKMRR